MDNDKKSMVQAIKQPVLITLILMIVCGLIFPLGMTALANVIFPKQANGSIVYADGEAVGSEYIGQEFSEDYFLKGRPSAYHYNTYTKAENGKMYFSDGNEFTAPSSGSNNYAPSNPDLISRIENDTQNIIKSNTGVNKEDIPADLYTASGSGLDPHISVESAMLQIHTISENSGISEERLKEIIDENTSDKLLGIFGSEVVNVLGVNMKIAKEIGIVSEINK